MQHSKRRCQARQDAGGAELVADGVTKRVACLPPAFHIGSADLRAACRGGVFEGRMPPRSSFTATVVAVFLVLAVASTLGGCAVPLVALTAKLMQEDLARYQAAGFDRCIGKPIDFDDFGRAIAALLGQAAPQAPLWPAAAALAAGAAADAVATVAPAGTAAAAASAGALGCDS